jgi:1,4-alpha-glucan branching enzyme
MANTENNPQGYLSIVLHAHLPFVRHPEQDYNLEENWLFEAITETYIPLLSVFMNLREDGVPFRITMSLTPPLCAMLTDELLQERYVLHIEKLLELAQKETQRTKHEPAFQETALMYREKYTQCKYIFETLCKRNLVQAFRQLQDQGCLEIITCGATHGFLPTMQYNKNAVRAQVLVAIDSYERCFGRKPQGIWLPECGYYPGVETILAEAGIRYFFTDTHGILFAEPRPMYGVFAPVYCKDATVAAFGRDIESSKSVWCSKVGYPGDAAYRDFYRDIGFDLDIDYILPYIDPIGNRLHTGIKYYKITGTTDKKEPYNHTEALNRALVHAGNFVYNRETQARYLRSIMDRKPIIVAPYDAELLGHWWYEGPDWLNFLIRKIAFEQNTVMMVTPSDYLAEYPTVGDRRGTPRYGWNRQTTGYTGICTTSKTLWSSAPENSLPPPECKKGRSTRWPVNFFLPSQATGLLS